VGNYLHLLLWTIVAFIHVKKNSQFALFFSIAATIAILSYFVVFIFAIKLNNTLYLIEFITCYFILTSILKQKSYNYLAISIFLFHLYNFYIYKFYELETLWFLAFDLLYIYHLDKFLRVQNKNHPFLTVLTIYYIVDFLARLAIVFNMFETFSFINKSIDIFAIYFIYSAFKMPKYLLKGTKSLHNS
jgi:hypothetical protein